MIIVGAYCLGGGVGLNGTLPWHNKADFKHFKNVTMGKTLLVGRITYEKLPPLRGRKVVKLSKDGENLDDYADKDVMLIGGPTVWKYALEKGYVDTIILTKIHQYYECDALFPFHFLSEFELESTTILDKITEVHVYKRKMN